MDLSGILFIIACFAMAAHLAGRVIHFASTGEGGINDPLILKTRMKGKHER